MAMALSSWNWKITKDIQEQSIVFSRLLWHSDSISQMTLEYWLLRLLASMKAIQISFSFPWHNCDKSYTAHCQSHCFTQSPLFTPHLTFQPTMSKSTLPTCIYHATSIPSACMLPIILFPLPQFHIKHSALTIASFSHFTSISKRTFKWKTLKWFEIFERVCFCILKYFKHFISPWKPCKALISNHSSLLVKSTIWYTAQVWDDSCLLF